MHLITLTTDFGLADGFVGSMKGVLLRLCPDARVVDITHQIPPHDVVRAAYVLEQAAPWFPQHTIHVVVVDPGVGTDRRILIADIANQVFIAPDNGVLTRILRSAAPAHLFAVTEPRFMLDPVSQTFHGRDIFTPVAAHIANGVPLRKFGPPATEIRELDLPEPTVADGPTVFGRVIYTDRFGNLMTNIDAALLRRTFGRGAPILVRVAGRDIAGLIDAYGGVAPGKLLVLLNSARLLEIAVNGGHAAEALGVGVGAEVAVVVPTEGGTP